MTLLTIKTRKLISGLLRLIADWFHSSTKAK